MKDKFLAVAEAMAIFLGLVLFIKYLEVTIVGSIQLVLLGWDFFAHFMMFAIPLFFVLISRGGLSEVGVSASGFKDPETRRLSRIVAAELFAVWIAVMLIPNLWAGRRLFLLLPPYSFANSLFVTKTISQTAANFIGWGLTVTFTVLFCGVGEEVFFRGFLQGRLNRSLGRPFRVMGVRFGWGLIIASLIFGLGHGIMYFNPFVSSLAEFDIHLTAAAVTAAEGLILGLVYERAGNVFPAAALHGAIGLFFGSVAFQ